MSYCTLIIEIAALLQVATLTEGRDLIEIIPHRFSFFHDLKRYLQIHDNDDLVSVACSS